MATRKTISNNLKTMKDQTIMIHIVKDQMMIMIIFKIFINVMEISMVIVITENIFKYLLTMMEMNTMVMEAKVNIFKYLLHFIPVTHSKKRKKVRHPMPPISPVNALTEHFTKSFNK